MEVIKPPPIRDEMFAEKNILQKTWVLFFENLFRKAQQVEFNETIAYVEKGVGETSTRDKDEVAMALLSGSSVVSTREVTSADSIDQSAISAFVSEKSVSSKTSENDITDILTLYWTGV